MKQILLSIFLFFGGTFAMANDDEIIIEMVGAPASSAKSETINLWDKNSKQLARLFAGKDKDYVLYNADSVPTIQKVIYGGKNKFLFLQYGNDKTGYRKLLFDNKTEKFLACADSLKEIFALNQKYNITIPFGLEDLQTTYPQQVNALETLQTKENETFLVYTFKEEDADSALYFVFDINHVLVKDFTNKADFEIYKKEIQPPLPTTPNKKASENKRKHIYKALVSGGTEWDKINLPTVHHPASTKNLTQQQSQNTIEH